MTEPRPQPGPLAAALEARDAVLPPVEGLEPGELVRWYARSIGAPWVLQLQRRHAGRGATPWAAARGGLVYVVDELSDRQTAALADEVARGEVRAVRIGGAPVREAPAFVAAVRERDRLHAVAADPALAELRRSLLSHARSAAPVHLQGPPGSDAADLARWAHALLDDRPLSTLRGAEGVARAGEWLLVEDIEELASEARQVLDARLRTPARGTGRVLPRRARPRHAALRAIVGSSGGLVDVLEQLLVLAPTRLPVLIVGEPGAGEESLARAVHDASGRRGPFVAIDMGALPESLAEAELFGHRKGAFTGADRARVGAFRSADGGTLFLDEIGNVSPALQAKLLRVLQQGAVRPLGDDRSVAVDVRVVAATNADLEARVRRGEFRRDLLGRLDGATLALPPLRDRLDDLEDLARHLLERPGEPWCERPWWGNLPELDGVLAALAALPPGPITPEALDAHLPHLATPFAATPIRTLLAPSRVGDRVDGLTRDFAAPALLVGRVRSVDELRRAAGRDARAANWVQAIEAAGDGEPACLDLGLLRRLSRAHVLVARGPGGLQVHALPGVGRPVAAGPLVAGAGLSPVAAGAPVTLGDAGEIQVVDPAGLPYLQLFVFAGAVAFEDHAFEAAARSEAQRTQGGATAQDTRHHGLFARPATASPPTPTANPTRVWAVSESEAAAVVELLMSYRGGSLKDHVEHGIRAWPAEQERLRTFLRSAPRLSQYLGRLVEYAPNEPLRAGLRAALAAQPDRELRLALWPKGVRKAL